MHISEEDLRNLSEAYVKEERLNDRQLELKKHMADCDRCYEIFCAQYVLQKQLSAHGLLPPESEKRVVFALKAAAGIYEMIQQKKETFHSNWEDRKSTRLNSSHITIPPANACRIQKRRQKNADRNIYQQKGRVFFHRMQSNTSCDSV